MIFLYFKAEATADPPLLENHNVDASNNIEVVEISQRNELDEVPNNENRAGEDFVDDGANVQPIAQGGGE